MRIWQKFISVALLVLISCSSQAEEWLQNFDLDEYKGKVVYLDFWASWCGPCRKSFPWLNEMETTYSDDGLVVIGINLDSDIEEAKSFLEKVPAEFVLFHDPEGELADQYKLIGMPSSFVLDRNGEVRHRHVGFKQSEVESYEASIKELLTQD